jgi:hypothetical protein
VRNIIFDLGGVVLEWNPDTILESYYADADAREVMKAAVFQHADWLEMDRGFLTEPEMLARLEKRTNRPKEELTGLFDAIRSSLQPKADTVALMQSLARPSREPAKTPPALQTAHQFGCRWDLRTKIDLRAIAELTVRAEFDFVEFVGAAYRRSWYAALALATLASEAFTS